MASISRDLADALNRVAATSDGMHIIAYLRTQRDDAISRLLTAPEDQLSSARSAAATFNEVVEMFDRAKKLTNRG